MVNVLLFFQNIKAGQKNRKEITRPLNQPDIIGPPTQQKTILVRFFDTLV